MKEELQKFIEEQMLPKKVNESVSNDDLLTEEDLFGTSSNLNEEDENLNEDEDVNESAEDKTMTEEELKIESLKIATNIAKLMSDVTTDDIITIADKVSGFIRDHQIGSSDSGSSSEESSENSDNSNSEENSDIADSLDLSSEENNNNEE